MKVFNRVNRKDLVVGGVYSDIGAPIEDFGENLVYVGIFDRQQYGKCHFFYPLGESRYPEIEEDGTIAFGLTGSDWYEEV